MDPHQFIEAFVAREKATLTRINRTIGNINSKLMLDLAPYLINTTKRVYRPASLRLNSWRSFNNLLVSPTKRLDAKTGLSAIQELLRRTGARPCVGIAGNALVGVVENRQPQHRMRKD